MTDAARVRLAESTYVEPLVDRWSAWTNLIAPLPAALHLLLYQLPLLRSYIEDPAQHERASQDPMFVGAPFASVPASRVSEMAALLRDAESGRAADLALARAAMAASNRLADSARGESLEPIYEQLDPALRGFVELVYDYHHRASARFVEPMLYHSRHYDESRQALRLATLDRDADRSYFLNTPRLAEPDAIDWTIPFNDPRVDDLFRLDVEPQPLSRVRDLVGDDAGRLPAFLGTDDAPPAAPAYSGDAVRVRYFGHACVLLEWRGRSVLTDAFVAPRPASGGLARYSYRDLPPFIDYVLITHAHQDHFNLETLLRLRHRIGCLVVPRAMTYLYGDISLKTLARTLGFRHVAEAETFDRFELDDGEIVAVPFLGEHSDVGHSKSAYVVRMGRRQMLVAADSDCLDVEMYRHIRRAVGRVDTAFLGLESVGAPMSFAYGSLFSRPIDRRVDESRRQHGCNSERGKALLGALGSVRLFNYAMGLEPWMEFTLGLGITSESEQWRESERLLEWARAHGFAAAERLFGCRELRLDAHAEDEPLQLTVDAPAAAVAVADDQFAF